MADARRPRRRLGTQNDRHDNARGGDGYPLRRRAVRGWRPQHLWGEGGDDILIGGGGDDRFVFAAHSGGARSITSRRARARRTRSNSEGGFSSFAQVTANAVQSGSDVVITLSSSRSITLKNTTLGQLHQDDFVFAAGSGAPRCRSKSLPAERGEDLTAGPEMLPANPATRRGCSPGRPRPWSPAGYFEGGAAQVSCPEARRPRTASRADRAPACSGSSWRARLRCRTAPSTSPRVRRFSPQK